MVLAFFCATTCIFSSIIIKRGTAGWERNHPRPNIKKTIPAKVRPVSNTYIWGKFMKKILRVCFPTSLGDFGPQSLLISPNSQFFIKQHREVKHTTFLHSFILWGQILHENFRNQLDRVIFGHLGPKLGQEWSKIGQK